jgi:hypothetical protein
VLHLGRFRPYSQTLDDVVKACQGQTFLSFPGRISNEKKVVRP